MVQAEARELDEKLAEQEEAVQQAAVRAAEAPVASASHCDMDVEGGPV